MSKRGKKKIRDTKSIVIISTMGILTVIFCIVAYLYFSFMSKSYVKDNKNETVQQDSNEEYEEIDGISNILLIGSDARNLKENSRADAILILTIDNVHKKLKLTSVMRDSFVYIPGHGEQKINHSFAIGGVDLLMKTLEENFKIRLHDYAIINFNGFQQLVDSIGGLELDVSESEMKEMNKFIPEVNPDDPHLLKKSGFQHLDGQQVLSYARIRKIGNGDFDRTQRQREVISAIIDKLKDTNILKYPLVASDLFSYVKTNIDMKQILNYAYTAYKINNFTPEQILIPVPELTESHVLKNKGWVLLMDIEQNAKILHDFIFDDIKYDVEDLDFNSLKKAIGKYEDEISTSSTDAKDSEPIYNKKDVINQMEDEEPINQNNIEVPTNSDKIEEHSTDNMQNENKEQKNSTSNDENEEGEKTKGNETEIGDDDNKVELENEEGNNFLEDEALEISDL